MSRVGLIQMTSGPDPEHNLRWIEAQVEALSAQGAEWIVTPENAIVFGNKEDYHRHAEVLGTGPLQDAFGRIAKAFSVWLVIGSFPVRTPQGVTTTLLVYSSDGQLVTSYDKLHMFDVDVADGHRHYRESDIFLAGSAVRMASTPFGELGLSICYDVRFPHLYSMLRQQGAQIILVPAAFTAVTGRAHWETLLRARAIETQCWVVAVNQGGVHEGGRETWGHSMVINPWGEIVASLAQTAATLVTDIDLDVLDQVRSSMPVQSHTRFTNQFLEQKSEL
ncbi:carbon-nitrogen hydrolase family protein [Vibrio ruber]|uniref:carbon-nitrogen hydrolase family protein n=1 Tax=Vibrio ruber TaxID=184755 RepID=UPI00289309B3|nr:carbon-nitrogen hydrolase family protein [Vibrio ruber]WNJ94185.1 carbon-nitrogen hydrolase family protein [Vibrio ruber]